MVKWKLLGRFQVVWLGSYVNFGVCCVLYVVLHSSVNRELFFVIVTCRSKIFVDIIGRCIMGDVRTI